MNRLLEALQPILNIPLIRRIRRNHGLEHATLHVLSRRVRGLRAVGHSDPGGFWLYGNLSGDDVQNGASQALERMRRGEHRLAVHPNCGTNLFSVVMLGTAATLLALVGSEREPFGKLRRIPLIAAGLLLATILGAPLGMRLQQYVTTLGDPGDLEIVSIQRVERGKLTAYRVKTRSS